MSNTYILNKTSNVKQLILLFFSSYFQEFRTLREVPGCLLQATGSTITIYAEPDW